MQLGGQASCAPDGALRGALSPLALHAQGGGPELASRGGHISQALCPLASRVAGTPVWGAVLLQQRLQSDDLQAGRWAGRAGRVGG